MARVVTVLLGQPVLNEDGVAAEAITPGHLVAGVASLVKHATANGPGRSYALERDELGTGITTAYAIADKVKVGAFPGGTRVYAHLASGEAITVDDFLGSNGDGKLKAWASGPYIARALETVTAINNSTRIRVEVN